MVAFSLVDEESEAQRDHNSWVGSSAVILHSNADRIVYFLIIYPLRTDVPKNGLGIPVLEKKLRNLALMVHMYYVYILYTYSIYNSLCM